MKTFFLLTPIIPLFHYSTIPISSICTTPLLQQTAARGERALKPPQGAAQSRVLWARILYFSSTSDNLFLRHEAGMFLATKILRTAQTC